MKFAPPGGEPYKIMNRLDGWIGRDPSRIPNSVAAEMGAALPHWAALRSTAFGPETVRQLAYERKKKVRIAWRRRFGLLTR
ncbi:hypothetical protein ACVWW6_005771 [Bradyrhizobium sp. USDA 3311]